MNTNSSKVFLGFTKLLVVAGYDSTDLNHAEVLDLLNEQSDCAPLQAYPLNAFGVAGALLDGNKFHYYNDYCVKTYLKEKD